ncbi:putative cytochrome P450 monooxygenase [Fusarium flagelliforme]|uniref:putative cytochrome P450 monooxygenase n=1 Tax=Fusarium flagelliforme TaxID=2675880 RepID=UPI001E8D3897|nr:putative cytochrome P450 monooxygenase [Fusarium flagelliforme]KAH7183703.1 putative cytochrome P450 monooxygenase [Fusarium flagelliforme]
MMFTDYSVWTLLPSFGIAYLLVNVIYNLFFHALAKLPGPFLAKLTKLWLFSEELGGDAANTLARLHKKHGQLIRVSPNEVAINNRDVFTTINRQGTRFYKEKTFYDGFSGKHGNLFTYQDPEYHSRRKRLMSPSFSQASLAAHQVIIYECMKPLLNEITENIRSRQPTAIFPAVRKFALDSICAFSFGVNLTDPSHIDEESRRRIFEALDNSPRDLLLFQHFSSLKTAAGMISKLFPKMAPDAVILLQTIGMERLIASRKATDLDQPGLFSNMQELLDSKEQKLSDEELIAESSTLFFAGTDTTASTVAIGLWHLLHKPDLYARLRAELKTIMPEKNSQPTLKELESLPLLSACIKEGLRITCPPRGRLPRVVPPEGLQCNGVFIPPGTIVTSPISYLLFDEKVFPQPLEYQPDRWLQGNAKELESYLYPFSRGTRSCIGQTLSLAEQRICISQFVRRFSPADWGKFRQVNLKEYINIVIMDDLAIKLVEAE